MHYVTTKSILSKDNGMNIYRGCDHGCIYCDSRSRIYGIEHDFEDVAVKENSLDLLRKALHNKKKRSMIATGSMSDPYNKTEEKIEYTRKCLEIILKYGHGFTCITKSNLVLRDLDLIRKINEKSKAVIQVTLTCIDEDISKKIEPNVCSTNERIKILERLDNEGIPSIVWLTPVLPFLTDTKENIEDIIDACISTNVKGIICFGMGLTLREGNREYFYEKLDEKFPGLKEKYIRSFGNNYAIASPHNKELMKLFNEKTCKNNILNTPEDNFRYLRTIPGKKDYQSKLF